MATRKSSTKAAVLETEETEVVEQSLKQTINAGIDRVAEQLGVESKNRYKVQRAIGVIAMQQAIEEGTFEDLLDATVAGADDLPAGFGLEAAVAAEKPAPKAKATKTAAKPAAKKTPAAKAPAKAAPRKRPQR